MVLSGRKIISSIKSLENANQGGGDKKAGTVCGRVGITTWGKRAMRCTKVAQGYCCNVDGLMFTVNPNVNQSRPIGTVHNIPYWDMTNLR